MRRKHPERPEEDPTGLSSAQRDFNAHHGPARLFYNRNSQAFFTICFEMGDDVYWPDNLTDGLDVVELYRKTSGGPDVKVTSEELLMMERGIEPYMRW